MGSIGFRMDSPCNHCSNVLINVKHTFQRWRDEYGRHHELKHVRNCSKERWVYTMWNHWLTVQELRDILLLLCEDCNSRIEIHPNDFMDDDGFDPDEYDLIHGLFYPGVELNNEAL